MKGKIFIALLTSIILCSCVYSSKNETVKKTCNSIYYWKTKFKLSNFDKDFIEKNNIERMYVRFFDVAMGDTWLQSDWEIVPIATTIFVNSLPSKIEIIPTVYITVEALRAMKDKELQLAKNITSRILAMCDCNATNIIKEVQLDCDWTNTTQNIYFKLCDEVALILAKEQIELSSTIRLHQLNSVAPPVKRGVLMLYNTGSIKDNSTKNSILQFSHVKPYLKNLKDYSLPLDFAYPTFSWGVLFRNGEFERILREVDFSNREYYLKDGDYKVLKNHYINKKMVLKGDRIRFENSPFSEIKYVKEIISKIVTNSSNSSTILYHLDSTNLSKYSNNEIHYIYSNI